MTKINIVKNGLEQFMDRAVEGNRFVENQK